MPLLTDQLKRDTEKALDLYDKGKRIAAASQFHMIAFLIVREEAEEQRNESG